jgi:5'-3' exonuclease
MAEGQHIGGIVGFLQSLNLLIANHKPKECVIVWEGGGSTRRRAIYPDYKSRRRPVKLNRFHEGDIPDTVENQTWQVHVLVNAMKNLPVRQIYVSDCEADDVIGYLAKYSYKDSHVLIV